MVSIWMCGYLAVLSIQDIRHKKISLWLVAFAISAGLVYALISRWGWHIFWDVLPGSLMCVMAVLIPGTMGIGDGLVGIVYGLVFGWIRTCIWLMIAFCLAAVVGIGICIQRKDRKIQIPLVPFLAIVHLGMCL